MKLVSFFILAAVIPAVFFLGSSQKENGGKGVYVLSLETWQNGRMVFRFPNDSVFMNGDLAVQQVMRLDQFEFEGKNSLMQSVDVYYLIDFKRSLYKDMGRDLDRSADSIPWKDLKEKRYGSDFKADLHFNENFRIKDTLWESRPVKRISYTGDNRDRYDIVLEQSSPKDRRPVFFDVVEQRFKGHVLHMTVTHPEGKGIAVYTTKYVPLDRHPVLDAMDHLK